MAKLTVLLLIAHFIGDFYAQYKKMCDEKYEKGWCSGYLYAHSAIIFIFSVIAVCYINYWYYALIIAVAHFFIDGLKSCVEKKEYNKTVIHDSGYELWTFVADQILHIIVIFIVAAWMIKDGWLPPACIQKPNLETLVFILLFVVCGQPANILTRRLLTFHKILVKKEDKDENSPKTGKLIGALERQLILFFMSIYQFSAIGFFVTAKSILRFSDLKLNEGSSLNKLKIADKSEYVLVGTFFSIFIAICCGAIFIAIAPDKGLWISDFLSWLIVLAKDFISLLAPQ